jgi:hypothetical protein
MSGVMFNRNQTQLLSALAAFLFTVILIIGFAACDTGPPGDTGDNQPPKAVAQASPQDTTTGTEVTFDARGSTDPDDDAGSLTYDWEFGDGTTGSGETVSHTYGSAGEYTAEVSVSDGTNSETDEVTVSITEPTPDSVAITYRPLDTDGNVLEDAEVTDGEVFGTGEFTSSVAYSTETREVMAERDGYENGSSTYTPESSQTVEIELAEKTAEVTVKAKALETETRLSSQLELSADGESLASGVAPLTTEVSVSVDELTVSAAEHEKDQEVYADTSATFVLKDSPVTVGQRRVAHCVNGLDNDGDGLVGVWTDEDGNDIPTKGDGGDPGCTSASDDGEPHKIYRRVGRGSTDTFSVSSAEGEHTTSIGDFSDVLPLPASINNAVGNVFVAQTNFIDSEKDNQGFGFTIKTGTEDNMTDTNQTAIVRDDNSVDGWRTSILLGVKPEWFADGKRYYKEIGVHQCKADESLFCDGSGGDEVIFAMNGEGASIISYAYESDKASKSEGKSATLRKSDNISVRSVGYVTGR